MTASEPQPRYAWCFSHGRMHTFFDDREPWCTANWFPLSSRSEDFAVKEHQQEWGGARFDHELKPREQMRLIAFNQFYDSERRRWAAASSSPEGTQQP